MPLRGSKSKTSRYILGHQPEIQRTHLEINRDIFDLGIQFEFKILDGITKYNIVNYQGVPIGAEELYSVPKGSTRRLAHTERNSFGNGGVKNTSGDPRNYPIYSLPQDALSPPLPPKKKDLNMQNRHNNMNSPIYEVPITINPYHKSTQNLSKPVNHSSNKSNSTVNSLFAPGENWGMEMELIGTKHTPEGSNANGNQKKNKTITQPRIKIPPAPSDSPAKLPGTGSLAPNQKTATSLKLNDKDFENAFKLIDDSPSQQPQGVSQPQEKNPFIKIPPPPEASPNDLSSNSQSTSTLAAAPRNQIQPARKPASSEIEPAPAQNSATSVQQKSSPQETATRVRKPASSAPKSATSEIEPAPAQNSASSAPKSATSEIGNALSSNHLKESDSPTESSESEDKKLLAEIKGDKLSQESVSTKASASRTLPLSNNTPPYNSAGHHDKGDLKTAQKILADAIKELQNQYNLLNNEPDKIKKTQITENIKFLNEEITKQSQRIQNIEAKLQIKKGLHPPITYVHNGNDNTPAKEKKNQKNRGIFSRLFRRGTTKKSGGAGQPVSRTRKIKK